MATKKAKAERTVIQRLHAVMKIVHGVEKDKTVGTGRFAYDVATYNAVLRVAREHLVANGVLVGTRQDGPGELIKTGTFTSGGAEIMLYKALYNVDFINVDNASDVYTEPVEMTALDHGDKAPQKAQTFATKAAIKKVLSLIDEEGDSDEDRPNNDADGRPASRGNGNANATPIRQPQARSDAKPAGEGKPISSGQVKFLERKIAESGLDVAKVCESLKVKALAEVTDVNWKDAVAAAGKQAA
jgi:hypothetical protein